jgi:hypothetical protein
MYQGTLAMENVFLFCAVLGGTLLVLQFVLALLGFGADHLHVGGLPLDGHTEGHFGIGSTGPHLPSGGHDVGGGHLGGGTADSHAESVAESSWWLGLISLRTIVAALTFFGLVGTIALQAGWGVPLALAAAVVSGYASMVSIAWLMGRLMRLRHDGTVQIHQSLGQEGIVYVAIPPNRSGVGKVQLRVQGRIAEYGAMTSGVETLPTGAKVVVVDIIGPATLAVESMRDSVTP